MLDQLYGFEIKNGKYQVQRSEAKIVRSVFEDIIAEKGPTLVAKLLNELGIPTRKKNGKWHHAMITKMVMNRRYSGELGYPQIVTKSIQDKAIETLKNNSISKARKRQNEMNMKSPYFKKLRCKNCGLRLNLFEVDGNKYWRCSTNKSKDKCDIYQKWDGIPDDDIRSTTLEVINQLIDEPEIIFNPGGINFNRLEIIKVDNQINELIKKDSNEIEKIDRLLKLKHQLAYAKYDEDYISETMDLKEKVKRLHTQSAVIKEVVASLIKEIRIDEKGKASFILNNYQVIEKQLSILRGVSHG